MSVCHHQDFNHDSHVNLLMSQCEPDDVTHAMQTQCEHDDVMPTSCQ